MASFVCQSVLNSVFGPRADRLIFYSFDGFHFQCRVWMATTCVESQNIFNSNLISIKSSDPVIKILCVEWCGGLWDSDRKIRKLFSTIYKLCRVTDTARAFLKHFSLIAGPRQTNNPGSVSNANCLPRKCSISASGVEWVAEESNEYFLHLQ